jgi:hypothetical protein
MMMAMRHALYFLALLAVCPGCGAASPTTVHVPLAVVVAKAAPTSVAYSPGLRLYVDAVDERSEPSVIGSCGEVCRALVQEGRTPQEFVQRVLSMQLMKVAIKLAPAPEAANRLMHVALVRFYVMERQRYQAEVAAAVQLRDPSGKLLFSAVVTGEDSTWGLGLSPKNYQEVLSGASFDLANHLIENADFQKAIDVGGTL